MYYQKLKTNADYIKNNELDLLFNSTEPITLDLNNSKFITLEIADNFIPKELETKLKIREYKINSVCSSISDWLQSFPDFIDNKSKYYKNFKIPKKKGGFREIDAPLKELKTIQKEVLNLLQYTLEIVPHNSAFAYIRKRSTIQMAEKLKNKNCILKMDLYPIKYTKIILI